MLTLERMKTVNEAVERSVGFSEGIAKKAFSPVHKFLFPRSHGYKWEPNKEVSDEDANESMTDIFSEGMRACIRIDAVFVAAAFLFGFSLPTAVLVAALHAALYTVWSYKVVSHWRTNAMNWMKQAVIWLVVISTVYLVVLNIVAQVNPSWYSNSVMVLGMMALWMTQLAPMENTVRRLNKEAPVRG